MADMSVASMELDPGQYIVSWDGKIHRGDEVASGIYFCHMEAGTFHASRKIMLMT
jgi:hypothetical protein